MSEISREDIAAMIKEGSLRDFLRLQMTGGKLPRQAERPAPPPNPPGHVVGAWPVGSQRPAPIAPQPPGAWTAALERYRDWLATAYRPEKPEPGQHCPCGCTPTTAKETQ
ncbi:hypothetical protein [Streptomyces sp. NPDC056387]|uniref:hypothetical protein n=1 Tax=Streptomyces sp. NPDC056387 TaxID=3345803 RepID=UPI0035D9D9F8